MKKLTKILALLVIMVLVLIAAGGVFTFYQSKPVSQDENAQAVRVEIPSGISVSKVSKLLKKNNLIKNEKIFYFCARFPAFRKVLFWEEDTSNRFVLKSGIYYISPNMTITQIQNLLSSGKQEFVKVSIPEGLTISQIAQILDDNRVCVYEEFKKATRDTELLQKYSIPAESFEGYLFPDTYFLNLNMKPSQVISIFTDNFFEKIKTVPNLSELSPEDLFETVTLSSIVEREYRLESEAPLIASVFKNRLRNNIGLYSCATIVYILTEIEGLPHPDRILIEDTKIDNPYNTYLWAGLPPGPISNPGLVALNAATNTPRTDYYFFQVADQNEGRHVFNSTFEEHKVNHNLSVKK